MKDLYQKYKGRIKNSYISLLTPILSADSITKPLNTKLNIEMESGKVICPDPTLIYDAFNQHEVRELKVVIIGQDPYHTVGIANGMCFSTKDPKHLPPSLRNILQKVDATKDTSFDVETLKLNNTEAWGKRQAKQGVLLLNTALTTTKGIAGAHTTLWKEFIEDTIELIAGKKQDLIWVLMGRHALNYKNLIQEHSNGPCFITSSHPSPFSCAKGCGNAPAFNNTNIFHSINAALEIQGHTKINW